MTARALLLAFTFALAGTLAGGEAPTAPPAVTPPEMRALMVDASRSNRDPANLDRIRFVADVILPLAGPREVWVFDSGARLTNALAGEVFKERYSDYLALFDAAIRPLAQGRSPALAILAGDGQIEVVTSELPDGYKPFAAGRATREAINNAVASELVKRHQATVASDKVRWLLLNTEDYVAPAQPPEGVLSWIASRRSDAVMLSLPHVRLQDLLQALEAAHVRLPGERLGGGIQLLSGPGSLALTLPEGTTAARILVHALGNDGSYSVRLVSADGKQLPTTRGAEAHLTQLDGAGVAQAMQIAGCEAGLQVSLDLAGPTQPYEVLVLIDNLIRHRMVAVPPVATQALYSGDTVTITHTWLRAPGDTPISPTLRSELESTCSLRFGDRDLTPIGTLALPATAGTATCSLIVPAPWTARVRTEAISLNWKDSQPLELAGGFTTPKVVEGKEARLEFVRRGGRRILPDTAIRITGPAGTTPRSIPLATNPDQAGTYAAVVPFTAADRGTWTIDSSAPLVGKQETGRIVARDGTWPAIAVTRNWLPLILGLIGLLLLLIGLWLWWFLTRPRLRDEVLLSGSDFHRLDGARGPGRATSYGCPGFAKRVVLRATRKGLVVDSLAPGVQLLVNARPIQAGPDTIVQPGSDLELRSAEGNVHGRLFATASAGAAWTHDQAMIDPKGFESELVVLAP